MQGTDRRGTITEERKGEEDGEGRPVVFSIEKGKVFADLRIGADVAGAKALRANGHIAYQGVIPGGDGFFLSKSEAGDKFRGEAEGSVGGYTLRLT